MIQLKDYQNRVLDSLRRFLRECAAGKSPDEAFRAIQSSNGIAQPDPYLPVNVVGLDSNLPYVCLRVPTGGGKTLLGCHATGIATTELLHADRAVVLWLVPSNTILDQTAAALRDPQHGYRRALELSCGAVEVVTIDEALRLSRTTVDGATVVIVATIQAFRAEETADRRVFKQAGALADHFVNVPASRLPDLELGPDGKAIPSLVNVLRLRRPICIVDEAHNARTDLSFEMLGKVRPSCIIEFTATPARTGHPSNVLHHVSAAELKAADMVKLPLKVIARHSSQRDQLLAEALTLRKDLQGLAEREAQETGEYLRPILLIQAEKVEDCEPLRERLISEFGLEKDWIRISTGKLDELASIREIASPKCPVTTIITVKKLGEGWDCPFAYVLCSLRETRSATAIEQIVGRILRLPGATAKTHPDLNNSYAFSVSASIGEVLAELKDALESNGFTKAEVERIVLPASQGALPFGLQPKTAIVSPSDIDKKIAEAQQKALAGKVRIDAPKGEITIVVPLDQKEQASLSACLKTSEAKTKVADVVKLVAEMDKAFGGTGKPRALSPYEERLDFRVPLLCIRENGQLLEFDSTFLLEHPWKLSSKDATLNGGYDPLKRPAGSAGTIDVAATGKVETNILVADLPASDFVGTLHQHVLALGSLEDWPVERLIAWLDRRIDHQDIPIGEMAEFLRKVVRGLLTKPNLDMGVLVLDRFRLRDEVARLIDDHRSSEREAAFQQILFKKDDLAVDESHAVDFRTITYEPSKFYDGGHQFKKHYFGAKPGDLSERTPNGNLTEEFRCAQFIDDLPEVKYWVRNLARRPSSFRLQTSTDWFYPDFVCQLNDERVLAVEYKGKIYAEGTDAEEKRAVGAVWAGRSGGRCLFVMPTDQGFDAIRASITRAEK